MSNQERDKEIFNVIVKAYDFEFDQKERLDGKLNNFIAIIATIATLNVGIGFFVLDKISTGNPFYIHLISSLVVGVGLFVSSMVKALLAYKPMKYYVTPEDPKRIIEKYKDLTKTHIIREVGATIAEATNLNKAVNLRKVKALHWVFWLTIFGIVTLFVFTLFMVLALRVPAPVNP